MTPFQKQRHTLAPGAARAQGNQGQHFYPVAGVVADAPALPDGGEDHFDFHPGESIADALAGAAAERKVGVAGQPGAELGRPAVGPEFVGSVKPAGIALNNQRRRGQNGSRRYGVPPQVKGLVGHPRPEPDGGVKAQGLGDDAVGKGQFGQVVGAGRPATQRLVQLPVKTGLNLRVRRQQIPCPGEADGGSFVAGGEHRNGLVAYLFVGQRLPVAGVILKPGFQQQREQVVGGGLLLQ